DYLRTQFDRVFRNFNLSVNMGRLRSIQIYITGSARRPGLYTVSSLSTLVNALFVSGGPLPRGSMRHIQLRRGGNLVTELDMYDLLLRGDKTSDVRLQPEDVIFIPTVGPQVAISGSLRNPAIYELRNERTIGDVVQMAGGLSPMANRDHATLERIRGSIAREVVDIALDDAGLRTAVADGDFLQVLTIVPRFDNTVTLRGNVANPGRFRWRAGMRLRDIIPDRESLVSRDYWRQQNLLGNPPVELDTQAERANNRIRSQSAVADINWSYAVIERQNPTDLLTNLIPFNLGKLVLEKDENQDLELRSGDVVTIFSQGDIRVPQQQQTRVVRLEGEFNAPGIYTVAPGETLEQVIRRAGGLTPQAYLFGSSFVRESTRRDQQERLDDYIRAATNELEANAQEQLSGATDTEEAALLTRELQAQRQALQRLRAIRATGRIVLALQPVGNDLSGITNMTLEDGDRFMVPSRPSVVTVLGEVYSSNSFIHVENRKVKEYLELAGGFTRNADKGHVYVIRADGSVMQKENVSGLLNKELYPGDAVMAPERTLKTSFMRELRSWAQIAADFGLAAAAIQVLRGN
ncbi:MAG: SLBB domain-containing protein, partial [Acidobacteriota bacterium]|nr:SLBB domain-containing protein [Acidobacteriota bacterium]